MFVAVLPLVALGTISTVAPQTLTGDEVSAEFAVAFQWLVGFSQAGLWALIAAFRRVDRSVDQHRTDSSAATVRGTD